MVWPCLSLEFAQSFWIIEAPPLALQVGSELKKKLDHNLIFKFQGTAKRDGFWGSLRSLHWKWLPQHSLRRFDAHFKIEVSAEFFWVQSRPLQKTRNWYLWSIFPCKCHQRSFWRLARTRKRKRTVKQINIYFTVTQWHILFDIVQKLYNFFAF